MSEPAYIDYSLLKGMRLKRYQKIKKLLYIKKTDKILDVGCSEDDRSFTCYNNENQIVGLDLLNSSRIDKKNFSYIKGDAVYLPFKNKQFDVVVCIGVLEHIHPEENFIKVLKEIERVGNKYAICVPHRFCFIEPHFMLPFWYFYPDFLKSFLISHFNLGSQNKNLDGRYQELNHPPASFYLNILQNSKVYPYFLGPILLDYIIVKK